MYGLHLTLRASAALTFRVLPSGILDIITYPFVPPTTLSGWLRRIWMLAEGYDLPETTAKKDAPYFVLPPEVISLGAYPERKSYVHKTKRKGVKDFKDTSFTRLVFDKKTGPTFQLHTWEYLTTDKLNAYVVSQDKAALEHLRNDLVIEEDIRAWGCKLGKEGFAFIDGVSLVQKLEQIEGEHQANTLLPLDTVIQQEEPVDFTVHSIHRHVWHEGESSLENPSPIKGYDMLPLALSSSTSIKTQWWKSNDLCFPVGLEENLAAHYDV